MAATRCTYHSPWTFRQLRPLLRLPRPCCSKSDCFHSRALTAAWMSRARCGSRWSRHLDPKTSWSVQQTLGVRGACLSDWCASWLSASGWAALESTLMRLCRRHRYCSSRYFPSLSWLQLLIPDLTIHRGAIDLYRWTQPCPDKTTRCWWLCYHFLILASASWVNSKIAY